MSIEETRAVKRIFLQEYGHFADKRITNLDKGKLFIIDDRGPGDVGADRKLFSWFCLMFAEIADHESIGIMLSGNVPQGERVKEWCAQNNTQLTDGRMDFNLRRGAQNNLADLAEAFRSIVKPGVRYEVSSYKYVCPRVANALVQLQSVLNRAWIQ
jgi:hypothetical protein